MILTSFVLAVCLVPQTTPPWWKRANLTPLFENAQVGEATAGWTPLGGTGAYTWEVDPTGTILLHGHGPSARNTFLSSEKVYGDFLLELDFKIDADGGNSGVQIRSHWDKENKRYYGYQIEIDPSKRRWSGGLYDEGRRAWLDSLADNPLAREAFVLGTWNRFTILCVGPRIRSWINDVPAADYLDFFDLSGHFALQVHSGTCEVQWRNMRLADFGIRAWKPLLASAIEITGKGQSIVSPDPLPNGTSVMRITAHLTHGVMEVHLGGDSQSNGSSYTLRVPAPFHGATAAEPGVLRIVSEPTRTTVFVNDTPMVPGAPALGAPLAVRLDFPPATTGRLEAIDLLPPTAAEMAAIKTIGQEKDS
jgi:hypothetical protein